MLCQTARMLEDMIDNKNDDDSVNLFCSSSCVMAYKVQTVSASGIFIHLDILLNLAILGLFSDELYLLFL